MHPANPPGSQLLSSADLQSFKFRPQLYLIWSFWWRRKLYERSHARNMVLSGLYSKREKHWAKIRDIISLTTPYCSKWVNPPDIHGFLTTSRTMYSPHTDPPSSKQPFKLFITTTMHHLLSIIATLSLASAIPHPQLRALGDDIHRHGYVPNPFPPPLPQQ